MKKNLLAFALIIGTCFTACHIKSAEQTHETTVMRLIENVVGDKDVTRAGDKSVKVTTYISSTTKHDDTFALWSLGTKCNEETIIFSFDNDQKQVIAQPVEKDLVDKEMYVDSTYKEFKNKENSTPGTFAWTYNDQAFCITDAKVNYQISSIWSYNKEENTITLLWKDPDDKNWREAN